MKNYVISAQPRDEYGGEKTFVVYDEHMGELELISDPEDATIFDNDDKLKQTIANLEYNWGNELTFTAKELIGGSNKC